MTRRCTIFGKALLCGSLLAASAWGQNSSSVSLMERISGRQDGQPLQPETAAEGQPVRTAARPGAVRSILPDWFSSGDDESRQPVQAQPRAGSAVSSPAQQAESPSLPGLGGSPLPKGKWTPSRSRATGDAARELSSDYPVIRDVTPEEAQAFQRPAPTEQSPRIGSSPTRHSPGLRHAPHINPDDLRRELSGTFTQESRGSAEATAQPDRSVQPGRAPVDTPLVLPPIDAAPSVAGRSTGQQSTVRPAEPGLVTPQRTARRESAAGRGATSARRSPGPNSFARSPRMSLAEAPARAGGQGDGFGEALEVANGGDPTVLVSNQMPSITADIRGPKQIMIGREAVYRVRLQNQGGAAAEGVVATVRVPSWADVVGSVSTRGAVQPSKSADSPTQLEWQLDRVDGRASESLDIRLVPRESRPLELGISWTAAPVGSRAIVEVQEPKLSIEVSGPDEVLFSKPQVFKLTLSNPGTGPAENVKIELVPPGGGEESATSHPLGDLQPGESRTVEIELTAREAGKLQIKAIASAEGGLASDAAKEIFCRKPELELDWRGPATQYSGTTATYFFRVRNPGTAPADNVTVEVSLPEGAEFTSASEGQAFDPQRRIVTWRVGTLKPGDDNYLELKCVVKQPGANQFRVVAASATGGLSDNATAETNVIALADLKLEVSDPSGAVAVGQPATYEIRIANRGASAAKDVTVVALFSEGIEPDQAEGAMYTVSDGRVSFQPIEELGAGREVTLRIRAHALQPGTHVFRAEVLCSDAEIKLAAEETTRFYTDEVSEKASAEQQAASRTGFESAVK